VVEALAQVARRARCPCRKEQSTDDKARPGDLFLSRLTVNGPGAVDVTVRDPLATSHPCAWEAVEDWHARQEDQKNRKYVVTCHRLGWSFVPFVVDTFGGMGKEACDLVQNLLKGVLGQKEGWQRRGEEALVWQTLSMSLAREIARQLVWGAFAAEGGEGAPWLHVPYAP
jgi:hypothetical protein